MLPERMGRYAKVLTSLPDMMDNMTYFVAFIGHDRFHLKT